MKKSIIFLLLTALGLAVLLKWFHREADIADM